MATRIAVFDDDFRNALPKYEALFAGHGIDHRFYTTKELSGVRDEVREFTPHLIVVDLLMGRGPSDTYGLIADIQGDDILKVVPIIVCSKLVNDEEAGREVARSIKENFGIEAVRKYPPVETFLEYANQQRPS